MSEHLDRSPAAVATDRGDQLVVGPRMASGTYPIIPHGRYFVVRGRLVANDDGVRALGKLTSSIAEGPF
jgi:hypothetical protein